MGCNPHRGYGGRVVTSAPGSCGGSYHTDGHPGSLHRAWLQVEAPAVARAYDDLVSAAWSEAGTQMMDAWNAAPLASDAGMNLKVGYAHPQADAEHARVAAAMRRHLRL